MIAGVCGGIAEWLGWDPTVVRILYVVVSVLSAACPGIIVYAVLWVPDAQGPRVETGRRPPRRADALQSDRVTGRSAGSGPCAGVMSMPSHRGPDA
jgi:phage shock protein PspC (stress-responsive transcriptional regulator)